MRIRYDQPVKSDPWLKGRRRRQRYIRCHDHLCQHCTNSIWLVRWGQGPICCAERRGAELLVLDCTLRRLGVALDEIIRITRKFDAGESSEEFFGYRALPR